MLQRQDVKNEMEKSAFFPFSHSIHVQLQVYVISTQIELEGWDWS